MDRVISFSPRRISTAIVSAVVPAMAFCKSLQLAISRPAMRTTLSPIARPASAAGQLGVTEPMRGSEEGTPKAMKITAKMRAARTKFIMDPPATKIMRCQTAFLSYRCSSGMDTFPCSCSSPATRRKPPIGSMRKEYLVSPLVMDSKTGPIPSANSCTNIPEAFAVKKCPSSWKNTSTPIITMAIKITNSTPPSVWLS